ncbi:MAG: DNA polymerase III alpha subunit [Shewanella sp.]|jgi:error-prone DNA polymerase
MGFYTPSQLIQDAKRHNIVVLPICINSSDWQYTSEYVNGIPALRLGLSLVKGIRQSSAIGAVKARRNERFKSINDVKQRHLLILMKCLKWWMLMHFTSFKKIDVALTGIRFKMMMV